MPTETDLPRRSHSQEEDNAAGHLSSLSMLALLYEVSTTPKPGLVDRNNTGAHRDMDIFTFEASAVSLNRWFSRFVLCGMENAALPAEESFTRLRALGIEAEREMFRATRGVNTHKGLIFALSLMNCALGRMYRNRVPYAPEALKETVRFLAAPVRNDLKELDSGAVPTDAGKTKPAAVPTAGEALYLSHGMKGARGEALSGYATVTDLALPVMQELFRRGESINTAGVITLLHIIAAAEDSNIAKRSSYEEMQEIRQRIGKKLSSGASSPELLAFAEELDREFIRRNISPGGSADLLALTFFLMLCENDKEKINV